MATLTARAVILRCPRCRGRLMAGQDWHGAYDSCLMCGYVHDHLAGPPIDAVPTDPTMQRRREPSHGKTRL